MRVESVEFTHTSEGTCLAGRVAGQRVHWITPAGRAAEPRGEPFVAALLPAAMASGQPIILPDTLPLDPRFVRHLETLQGIFARWFDWSVVPIEAVTAPRTVPGTLRATGYSGGVDSAYTVDALGEAIDGVVLIDGIEYPGEDPGLMADVTTRLADVVTARGLELLVVRTNVKAFGRALGGKWSGSVGAAVASAAHALNLAEYHVAASNSWENLRPYGSHPLTDPLWGSATLAIHHHGAELRRVEKLDRLRHAPDLLAALRVCFQGGSYNCGVCQKCLMTRAALRALGMTSALLPALDDPRRLRDVYIEHQGDLVDWEELLPPARARGDAALVGALEATIRRHRWREVMRGLDELLTGGRLRRARRRVA